MGRKIVLKVDKKPAKHGETVLELRNLSVQTEKGAKKKVNNVSFQVRSGEITCIAGIDNNGQSELVLALAGMMDSTGEILLNGQDISHQNIRFRNTHGLAHIPEDRHKHGLVLDFNISENIVLQTYFLPEFSTRGFLKSKKIGEYSEKLIKEFDIRSANGPLTIVRGMSGGNQQKIILAREISREHNLLIAVQPTRGLDIGATEFIHSQLVQERDNGQAVLLVSV